VRPEGAGSASEKWSHKTWLNRSRAAVCDHFPEETVVACLPLAVSPFRYREDGRLIQGHPSRVMTAAIQMGDVAKVAAYRTVAQ
jgi:hypothetical protein